MNVRLEQSRDSSNDRTFELPPNFKMDIKIGSDNADQRNNGES